MRRLGCCLLLANFLCACSQAGVHPPELRPETPPAGGLQTLPVVAEPRGIVGEFCPPVLAAKGIC